MTDEEKLKKALDFATDKHSGQFRKGGLPYITHPVTVSEIVKANGGGIDAQITALFHDLLEDTDATEEEIDAIGGKEVLEAVKLLTKKKGYVMEEYVEGIRSNPIAKMVKAADRLHNLQSAFCTDDSFKRRYILESIDWYLDFSPEIPKAVKALVDSLDQPLPKQSLEYEPLDYKGTLSADGFALYGNICYSLSPAEIRTVKGYAVCIGGKSMGVFEKLPDEYSGISVIDYGDKLIVPGMVDLHIHAPQYAFRGMGMDMELMDWLEKQAFPEEEKYEDLSYAEKAYSQFAEQMKKSATTRACIFATKHRDATEILMDKMEQTGIISYVGKVNMDREAPPALCEPNADFSAFDTYGWLNDIKGKYRNTMPILTPRFVPCCTDELLSQLEKIQQSYDLPVQSHLSENRGEIEWVKEHCPDVKFYGDAYDRYGLFGKTKGEGKPAKTIMAHCVYSSDEEAERLCENGVFIAHCPTSNMNLSSGIAPIRRYIDMGARIGLGSDVAGGQTESIFRSITDAIQVSKLYWRIADEKMKPLTFEEAFYMATMGGGEFFGKAGSFEKDYEFDAVVLDDSLLPHPQELTLRERLERSVYMGLDEKGICAKYAAGNKII